MKNGYQPISSGEKKVIPSNMGSHVRNENELHNCKRCPFDNNCEHHHGLYSVDIGHTVNCCNDCGLVLFHGTKKAVELYILQEKELEFDFGAHNDRGQS